MSARGQRRAATSPPRRAQLGPPLDRPVPDLSDRRRLDRRRLPEAEVLGGALCCDRQAGARRAIRDSPTSPRATATATSWSRSSSRCFGERTSRGVARRAPRGRRAFLCGERRASGARRGSAGGIRAPRARNGTPSGVPATAVRCRAAGAAGAERGEHTEAGSVELCGYTPERVRELDGTVECSVR